MKQELTALSGRRYVFTSDRYFTPPGKFSVTFKGVDEQGNVVLLKKVLAGFIENEITMPVRHPAIVPVTDVIRDGQDVYLVQAFKEGMNLRNYGAAYKSKHPVTEVQLGEVFFSIVDAVGAMHNAGWMHGDVKPGNIILDFSDRSHVQSWLVDFGKASPIGRSGGGDESFSLLYSAPERVLRETDLVDASSDFYALGVTLYELLERRVPFRHSNPELLLHLMINQPLPVPRYIPKDLFEVIRKMTFKAQFARPAHLLSREERRGEMISAMRQRYTSAEELKSDLQTAWTAFKYPRPWWKLR